MFYRLLGVKRQINLIIDSLFSNICLQSAYAAMNMISSCIKMYSCITYTDSRPVLLGGIFIILFIYPFIYFIF